MNDINRIEEFLNLIKLIATNYNIDKNIVYGNLVHCKDNCDNIEELFIDWIKEFENEQSIKVYIPSKWPNFCQFKSIKSDNTTNDKIKIYISLDKEHINIGVNQIFHYLTKIKATHISKVAKNIRYDDIVIRVDSIDTAKQISKFISQNKYIKEGIIETNPFAFNDGFISYAWDGDLSYNMVLSTYITDYINTLKYKNELNKVSYINFVSYLKNIYKEVFIDGKNLEIYKEMMDIEDYNYSINEIKEKILNYQNITKILLKALMPDKKMDDFYQEYIRITSYGNNIYDYIYHNLIKKYHNYHYVDDKIFNYLLDNDSKHFTKSANGINIRKIIEEKSITNKKLEELIFASETRSILRNILFKATIEILKRYNEKQTINVLISCQKNNLFYSFISKMFYKELKHYVDHDQITGIIRETLFLKGYDIAKIPYNNIELYNEYIKLTKNYLHNNIK